jgi:hypothetical protein
LTLLYDSFGVRRVWIDVNFWPELRDFRPGELSQLYAHLNSDDLFLSCDLNSNQGARFDGEQWAYDITSDRLALRCFGYESVEHLRGRIREMLRGTREFFAPRRVAFFVDEVRMFGVVPDDRDRPIGEVVRKRLLRGTKAEELEGLPGLVGAGLRLVGDTDEFHWHANIEPPHGSYGVLGLGVEAYFTPDVEPPTPETDIERISGQVDTAYTFLNDQVREFASKLFH